MKEQKLKKGERLVDVWNLTWENRIRAILGLTLKNILIHPKKKVKK